jgi:hypothetical protein
MFLPVFACITAASSKSMQGRSEVKLLGGDMGNLPTENCDFANSNFYFSAILCFYKISMTRKTKCSNATNNFIGVVAFNKIN